MSNKLKEIDINNCTYYFFDDMINIKNLDPNKIKTNEKFLFIYLSFTLFILVLLSSFLIYCIRYLTVKDLSYATINSVNPLYLIINEIN